jgi:phosphotransferase system enzyme I (PtsI)
VQLTGIGVSTGIGVGEALIVEREAVPVFRLTLAAEAVAAEEARLAAALEVSRRQVQAIRDRLARTGRGPHAYIFDAHLLMLEDPLLLDRALALMREQRVNAEWALRTVGDELHASFQGFTDAYLRERQGDLDDVLGRVQINLGGGPGAPSLRRLPAGVVLVATELTPSDLAELDWPHVRALAMDSGSATHHTSILARSFGVPAVVGLGDATRRIAPGTQIVVDGTRGRVLVGPSAPLLAGARAEQERDRQTEERLRQTQGLPAHTRDGVAVCLRANVEFPDEAASALRNGAEGIGLFRSEYLLGRSRQWPTEERQYEVYRHLLERMHPHPVTVRTWDVGPEDLPTGGPSSPNPALGERALRLLRHAPEAFRSQLRALLRASAHGPLRVMFPFLSGLGDLRVALDLMAEVRASLQAAQAPLGHDVQVGLNLEIPSAALTAEALISEVDFLSIGTNDLVQYLLAADRIDPRVSAHYQPLHPAVLRVIRHVLDAAARGGVPVSVCGEMAADPRQALVLLGLGVRELSMSPGSIPRVKAVLRAVRAEDAGRVAQACLELGTADEVEAVLERELRPVLAADERDGRSLIEVEE